VLNKDTLKIICNSYSGKAKDIGESISLLNLVLDELMNKINQDVSAALIEKNYDIANVWLKLHEYINEAYEENREIVEYIESNASDDIEDDITGDLMEYEDNTIPNYDDYKVDQSIPHTLYEDFEHKRPKGFKLLGNFVEANTWAIVLLETCEMLYNIDERIFTDFTNDKNMNGKKRDYFSFTVNNIRKPKKIKSADIYIEINLSANSIKQIIIKMLKKYQIKLHDYVVYYRADYTELNKK
jgi:uncharacterized protein YeeX (DUF496 family)